MFVHPNEFELLQHLEVPGRARHDDAPDAGQDGWRSLRVTVRKLTRRHGARSVLKGLDLDIAAGRGLREAVVQSTQIGAVNSWLRNQPTEVVSAAVASVREALTPFADGARVRLPSAMWLISSAPA